MDRTVLSGLRSGKVTTRGQVDSKGKHIVRLFTHDG